MCGGQSRPHYFCLSLCVFRVCFVKSPGINADIRPLTSPIITKLYTINLMAYNEIESSPLLSCRQNSQSTAAVKTMETSAGHYCILLKLKKQLYSHY